MNTEQRPSKTDFQQLIDRAPAVIRPRLKKWASRNEPYLTLELVESKIRLLESETRVEPPALASEPADDCEACQ